MTKNSKTQSDDTWRENRVAEILGELTALDRGMSEEVVARYLRYRGGKSLADAIAMLASILQAALDHTDPDIKGYGLTDEQLQRLAAEMNMHPTCLWPGATPVSKKHAVIPNHIVLQILKEGS